MYTKIGTHYFFRRLSVALFGLGQCMKCIKPKLCSGIKPLSISSEKCAEE
jgi:hypothetical protein